MKKKTMTFLSRKMVRCFALLLFVSAGHAMAAQGEMGAGVPGFGLYSTATGVQAIVLTMTDVVTPLPAGCVYLSLTPATMGMDAYKIAIATMLVAKTSNRRVRFYAHAPRDTGCGVDYVELL